MANQWINDKSRVAYNKGRDAVRGDRWTLGRFASNAPSADLSSPLGKATGGRRKYTFKADKEKAAKENVDFLVRMQAVMVAKGR